MKYADCGGSYKCENIDYPYRVQYGVINSKQMKKREGVYVCGVFEDPVMFVKCAACRCLQIGKKQIKVFHCGTHLPRARKTYQTSWMGERNIAEKSWYEAGIGTVSVCLIGIEKRRRMDNGSKWGVADIRQEVDSEPKARSQKENLSVGRKFWSSCHLQRVLWQGR